MKRVLLTLLLVSLPGALCAAGSKTAGRISIVDDTIAPAASVGAGAGNLSLQGYIGAVDSGQRSNAAPAFIEAGFYSRFISSPSTFGYNTPGANSVNTLWTSPVQDGALYQSFTSTANLEAYFQLLGTTDYQQLIGALESNTTYYHYLMANYMEGDYAPYVSTAGLTLSAAPSAGAFVFRDIGPGTVELGFPSANPGPSRLASWTPATPNLPAVNYGLATAVYGNYMYISGGNDGVKFSSAVYYSRLNADGALNSWTSAGYMPAARYGHQLFAARGRLYVLGGFNAGSAQSTVWSAAVSSTGAPGAWTPENSLSVKLYFHAAVYYNGYVYVSGGYSGSVSGAVCIAPLGDDGVLGGWTTSPNPLPDLRYGHTMNEVNGALYVVGGNNGSGPKNTVWRANITGNGTIGGWTAQASLPLLRFAHKTAALGGKLVVTGGNNGTGPQNLVWVASVPAGGGIYSWTQAGTLPEPSQFHAVETVDEKIYILGGYNGTAARDTLYSAAFTGTQYQAQASTDSFVSVSEQSAWSSDTRWKFRTLSPGTNYSFKVKARNWAQAETAFSAVADTVTYAAVPATAAWTSVFVSSGTANWLAGENAGGTLYQCDISSYASYSPVSFSSVTAGLSAYFDALQAGTTWYARVKAFNPSGVATRFADLPSAWSSLDPALDTSSPTITDNQAGDDAWRATNTTVYDVDFADTGGGQLSSFTVLAAASPGGADAITGWVDVSTMLAGTSWTDDWTLPQDVWDALTEGVTAYISVKVFDTVSNSSETADAFYVLKDTTPPTLSQSYPAPAAWVSEYPGTVPAAFFSDSTSKLARAQYSVSTNKLSGNANTIGWTDIGSPAGSAVYSAAWDYDFTRLANGVTNYFSLKAVDAAGNETVLVDTFTIQKVLVGPVVAITSPSALFLSTLTVISGSVAETASHAITGTEIAVLDSAAGRYWDGAGFTAPTRVWHTAAGTHTFTLTVSLPLISGSLYEIVARSSDTAAYSSAYSTVTFTYDTAVPLAAVTAPADGSGVNSPAGISGTAADAISGVRAVQLSLRGPNGLYWDAVSTWTAAETALDAAGDVSWTYNLADLLADSLVHGGTYYCSPLAYDRASPLPGNRGAFGVSGSTFVYYDTTPPGAPRSLTAATGGQPGTAALSWIAPGDNGASGYLALGSLFMVQASTWAGAAFSTAAPANVSFSTSGIAAGSLRIYTSTGLGAGATYYFAMWARDDALNWSVVSGTASAVTGAANTGSIFGLVMQVSSQPLNGIIVEALDENSFVRGSGATGSDGTYELGDLDRGNYTVQATWAANDITSAVSMSDIATGSAGVNFILSIAYELAEISGYIPAGFKPAQSHYARTAGSARFAPTGAEGEPFVELFVKGRRVAAAPVDTAGRFRISNLLPGTYSIRVFNGREFTELTPVKLKEGEIYNFVPQWAILSKEAVYAYPNPARTSVNIHFETNLTSQSDFEAEVSVFNIGGGLVKTFRSADVSPDTVAGGPGSYKVAWNFANEKIASGVYLYAVRLKYISTGKVEKAVKKLAIIR